MGRVYDDVGRGDPVSTSLRSVGPFCHVIGRSRQCGETWTRLRHGTEDPFVMKPVALVSTEGSRIQIRRGMDGGTEGPLSQNR